MDSLTTIERLLKLAKEYGALELEVNGVRVVMPASVVAEPTPAKDLASLALEDMPGDDDMLLWSAGGPLPSEVRKVAQEHE